MTAPLIWDGRDLPPPDRREIFRYAGAKLASAGEEEILSACLPQALSHLSPRVCYRILPCFVAGDAVSLPGAEVTSASLARHLTDCPSVLLMAATLGHAYERALQKAVRLSPLYGLFFEAIGAERVEALCDRFCAAKKEEGLSMTARYSPGYGDLPLGFQKDICSLLDGGRMIGLSLTGGGMLLPSKSVTAAVGLYR